MQKLVVDEILKIKDSLERYYYLVDKTYDLIMAINSYKNFPYEEHIKKAATFQSISYDFEYNTIMFEDIYTIIYTLTNFVFYDSENEVKRVVKYYNKMVDVYDQYVKIYNEIEEYGFDKLDKEIKDNLIELFKDMLNFKNKKYEESDDFDTLLGRVRLCYYDFARFLDKIGSAVKSGAVPIPSNDSILKLDSVEYLNLLREVFNKISSEYQNYVAYKDDIDLKDGETIEDLVREIDNKLNTLYSSIIKEDKMNYKSSKIFASIFKADRVITDDDFIKLYPDYAEYIYQIRGVEQDNQLLYYLKRDLYEKLKNDFE